MTDLSRREMLEAAGAVAATGVMLGTVASAGGRDAGRPDVATVG